MCSRMGECTTNSPSNKKKNPCQTHTIGNTSQLGVAKGIVVSVLDQLGVGDTGHEALSRGW